MSNPKKYRCPFCLEEYDSFEEMISHINKCKIYVKLYKKASGRHEQPR